MAAMGAACLSVSFRQLEANSGSVAIAVSQELRLQEGEGQQHCHSLQLLATVMPASSFSTASTPTVSPLSSSPSALASPASSLASPIASSFPFSAFPSSSAFPHAAHPPPRPRVRRDSQQSVRPVPRTIHDWLSAAAQFAYSGQPLPLAVSSCSPTTRSVRSLSTSSPPSPAVAAKSSSVSPFPSHPVSPAVSSELMLKQRRSSEPHCYTLSSHTVYTPTSASPLLASAASTSRPSVSVSLPSSASVSQTVSPASSSASLSPLQQSRYFSLPSELLRPLTAKAETEEETMWTEESKKEAAPVGDQDGLSSSSKQLR